MSEQYLVDVVREVNEDVITFTLHFKQPILPAPVWWREEHGDEPYFSEWTETQGILLRDRGKERFYNYGSETWSLSKEEISALLAGKTLAREINGGEYGCFLKLKDES